MALFNDTEKAIAEAIAGLSYCNPFLPERIDFERAILGRQFVGTDGTWHKHIDDEAERPNIGLLTQRAKVLADSVRERLLQGVAGGEAERLLYEDTALYYLYNKYAQPFLEYLEDVEHGAGKDKALTEYYREFQGDMAHYFGVPGVTVDSGETPHLFACFYQVRRAWRNIYDYIIGGSTVSVRLRAAVWQSIFTCDMRRYRRGLFRKMGDITTLIVGPSGTGKELVARAIGLSRYIAFDPKTKRFAANFARCFYPINLSALSPTLIESELFGHEKGAFTGAIADRAGFFELCPEDGAVFLDEIGELDPPIQVKLLRVLQTRSFQRIGDSTDRKFRGKAIAATNRDPAKEMEAGRFRADLYYRLCSDIIVTPRLRDQLEGSPEQLHNLLLFIARHVAGAEEAEALANEVGAWIDANIEPDYAWPGNVRELEQCVRNILIRKAYRPFKPQSPGVRAAFFDRVAARALTAGELLRGYCTMVYAETGSYEKAAERLALDRRTVKAQVDRDFLEALRSTPR